MRKLITICARGGSKGIPGKNIKLINGKPLIYYTCKIAAALANHWEDTDICLSTDAADIKGVVERLQIEAINLDYTRPPRLATDTAGKMGVIKDVVKFMEIRNNYDYDYILDLDVTSPLRSIEDLTNAYDKLVKNPDALNIFSVNPANRNPYFNMVEQKKGEEYVKLCKEGHFLTRQSAPQVFDVNASFYIYRKTFFETGNPSAMTNKTLIYEMAHTCFDLDHPIDFEFMSYLLEEKKLDFDFLY